MSKSSHLEIIEQLKFGLIVSCQPLAQSPMNHPDIISAMAQAAVIGGAVGLRIEGVENLRKVRSHVQVPIIGIIKRNLTDSPIRITPFLQDVEALVHAGADIIAFDASFRPRPTSIETLVQHIKQLGALAMADCANLEEGLYAQQLGVEFIASTLSGYTGNSVPTEPDYQLVQKLHNAGCRVIAEGRYNSPELALNAMKVGAYAVTVGTALTRLECATSWFVKHIKQG